MKIYRPNGLPKEATLNEGTLAAGAAEELDADTDQVAESQALGFTLDADGVAELRAVGAVQDDDGIATAQAPTDSTPLSLEAAAADLNPPRALTFTSASDLSGVTFTIAGTNEAGAADTEDVVGPNAETVQSSKNWSAVTSITPAGSSVNDVEVGWPDQLRQLDLLPAADPMLPARPVSLTSTDDLSGVTFQIQGQDASGTEVSENLAGPNNGTVVSTTVWSRVFAILPDITDAGEVSAGWPASSAPLPMRLTVDAASMDPARFITISSVSDLSARTFTITGTDENGAAQSEQVTGPNNGTVTSENRYASVSSIEVDDDVVASASAGVAADMVQIFEATSRTLVSHILVANDGGAELTAKLYLRRGSDDILWRAWTLGTDETASFVAGEQLLPLSAGDRLFLQVDASVDYSVHGRVSG